MTDDPLDILSINEGEKRLLDMGRALISAGEEIIGIALTQGSHRRRCSQCGRSCVTMFCSVDCSTTYWRNYYHTEREGSNEV